MGQQAIDNFRAKEHNEQEPVLKVRLAQLGLARYDTLWVRWYAMQSSQHRVLCPKCRSENISGAPRCHVCHGDLPPSPVLYHNANAPTQRMSAYPPLSDRPPLPMVLSGWERFGYAMFGVFFAAFALILGLYYLAKDDAPTRARARYLFIWSAIGLVIGLLIYPLLWMR